MEKDLFLKVVFIFVASYVLLFVLGALSSFTGLRDWGFTLDFFRLDYFFFLIPIPGFFIMFFLIDWIEEFFETRFTRRPWFVVFFLLLGVLAFYIATFWYFCNLLSLNDATACSSTGANNTFQYLSSVVDHKNAMINFLSTALPGFLSSFFSSLLKTNFVKLFLESAYIVFLLAGVLGWGAKMFYFNATEGKKGQK